MLFTDLGLGGDAQAGLELAKQAVERRPGLKVLFTSGYTQNPVKTPDGGDARVLTKPFKRQDLAAMLRSALATPSR